jgi:hypothetical protein
MIIEQGDRRRQVQALHQKYCAPYYDPSGERIAPWPQPDHRCHWYHAMSFLAGPDAMCQLGINILRRHRLAAFDAEHPLVHAFSHMLSVGLLAHYGDQLPTDVANAPPCCRHSAVARHRTTR